MNRTGERLAGRTDWAGKTDEELLAATDAVQIRANDRAVLDADSGKTFIINMSTPEGERILHSVKFPLRDGLGRRYVGSITADITEQRGSEDAAREAQQKLQSVADALPAVVTLCDRELRFLWINQRGAQWLRNCAELDPLALGKGTHGLFGGLRAPGFDRLEVCRKVAEEIARLGR